MQNNEVMIRLSGITKRYGNNVVLDNVDYELNRGEVHALVGENGAGKTTLVKVLYGLVRRDRGEIWIKGTSYRQITTSAAKKLGLALIPQKLQMLPNLTVAENLFINNWPRGRGSPLINWRRIRREAAGLLSKVNLEINPNKIMGELSYVDQQMIVITRMLFAEKADVIILDEPTAPLVENEIAMLFDFIASLKNQGFSFIYISHFLSEVFRICDRATVLRDGEVVFTKDVSSLTMRELIKGMVGEDVELFPKREPKIGTTVFEVKHFAVKPVVQDVSFTLREGEILGLAGLKGSGRTEIARGVCGLDAYQGGEILLGDRRLRIRSVRDALDRGIGYLTEDRIKWGLVGCRPLKENSTITFLKKIVNWLRLINIRKERELVKSFITRLDIRTTGPEQLCDYLSGGNQQKVILSKLLGTDSSILFLDEPTFGIDVKAKTSVYRIMNDFVGKKGSIVLISADMMELIEMCDRILTLRDGRIDREFRRGQINEKELQEILERKEDE
jgi:ribose transport system ATP-binding protein